MVYFSIDFNVDRDIIYLTHNDYVKGSVMPDSHGQYFVIDLRDREFDTDIDILITKTTMPEIPLKVELSMTVCMKRERE